MTGSPSVAHKWLVTKYSSRENMRYRRISLRIRYMESVNQIMFKNKTLIVCILLGCQWFVFSAEGAEQAGPPLKVITHNVWYGFTKKAQPRHELWLSWMRDQSPDVVALQELNGYSQEQLEADAKAWGHNHTVLLKEDGFPTGITSKYPISEVRRIRESMHHGLIRCRIKGLWFYVVHFHPSNFAKRIEEAAILAEDIKNLPDDAKIILAGDFNGFSPAEPFSGSFPTQLVSDENHGTDRRLDYIFVSPNVLAQVKEAKMLRDELTEKLSDHVPVMAVFELEH